MEMVDESPNICEEEITVDAVKMKDLKQSIRPRSPTSCNIT